MNNCLDHVDGVVLLNGARTARPGAYPSMSVIQKLKILLSSLVSPGKPVIRYAREGMVKRDDPLLIFRYTLCFMRIPARRQMAFQKAMNIPVVVGVCDSDELFSVEACR